MKLTRTVCALGLAGLAALNSPLAAAAEEGWYGGIGAGRSLAKIHDERIGSQLLGSGFTMTSISDDDQDFGYKLFAGRKFNKNFAVEGGYFNLGKFGFTANTAPPGSLTGTIKLQGVNLDAVGMLPFTPKFSALGRVGLTYVQAKDTFQGTGAVTVANPNPSKSEANVKFGVGFQYDFTPVFGLRGEWERYFVNDAVGNKGDIDMLLIGLVYSFSR
jgi:OOP family OmpA-OmpF porin